MSVVVIGDALIDEMRSATGSIDSPGGSALNVAVGLAVLGRSATLVAMFGDDDDGFSLMRHLDHYKVRVLRSPAPLGTGRAISDRTDGEPRYAFTEAQVQRHIDFTSSLPEIGVADAVAVSGFPFDNDEQVAALTEAVAGRQVFVDPNPRAGLILDRARFVANLEQFSSVAAVVKVGEEDAHLLWSESLEVVTARVLERGASVVLATAGAQGATATSADFTVHRGIARSHVPIVDTMGAGDATFASIVASITSPAAVVSKEFWGPALERAMAVAAETIRNPGGLLRVPADGIR